MDDRSLGQSGIRISVVGLGGLELGPDGDSGPDVDNAVSVVSAAIEEGVNWLDTSENYLATRNESLIGEVLARIDREFLVASKVAPSAGVTGGGTGFRPEEIHAACRKSLTRLRRDHIDVYLLHWPAGDSVPLDETWGAMATLVEQGLVRSIGMSNHRGGDVERCHEQRPVDVIQDGLSLVDHLHQREKIRRCGELGIAATVYEPLAGGVLSGKTAEQVLSTWTAPWTESPWFQRVLAPGKVERSFAVADGVRAIAAKLGATVAQVAIAWVLHQPGVAAAIAGSGSGPHTCENAAAAGVRLDDQMLEELEALIALGPAFG